MREGESQADSDLRSLLIALEPEGYGGFEDRQEAWPTYHARVGPLLPNFPEVVLRQWVWRHYRDAVSDYGWIGLPYLRFSPATWSTERILGEVQGWENHGLIEHWTKYLRENAEAPATWLGSAMIERGTWPEPPMVVDNESGLARPDGLRLGRPYHLMEGHHRLGFLHAIATDPRWKVRPEHDLLIVSVEESEVLPYWPRYD